MAVVFWKGHRHVRQIGITTCCSRLEALEPVVDG